LAVHRRTPGPHRWITLEPIFGLSPRIVTYDGRPERGAVLLMVKVATTAVRQLPDQAGRQSPAGELVVALDLELPAGTARTVVVRIDEPTLPGKLDILRQRWLAMAGSRRS
jgi:hypothetical protein